MEADVLEGDFWHPGRGVGLGLEVELGGVLEDFGWVDGASVFEGEGSFWDGGVAVG